MVQYAYISETVSIHTRMTISPMSLKTFLELMPTLLCVSHQYHTDEVLYSWYMRVSLQMPTVKT